MAFCRKAYLQGAGARWREKKFAPLSMQTANEFRKPSVAIDSREEAARALYRRCFDFGWRKSAYDHVDFHKPIPSFSYVQYVFFRSLSLRPFSKLRSVHRRGYVALRSAWLNGHR